MNLQNINPKFNPPYTEGKDWAITEGTLSSQLANTLKPESISIDQWEIRDTAAGCDRAEQFAEAAKLRIKLFVNGLGNAEDTKLLQSAIYNLINKPCMGITDFNFNEIQVIINACKNANFTDKIERFNNKELCAHLIKRTNNLAQEIDNYTKKFRMLIYSQKDEGSHLELPQDVIFVMTKSYLDIIEDIGNTPVDISRAEMFPIYLNPEQPKAKQIRLEAENLMNQGEYINSAKKLLPLVNTNIHIHDDSILLHATICRHLQRNEACSDFNLSEFITIKSSCEEVIDLKYNDDDIDIRAEKNC